MAQLNLSLTSAGSNTYNLTALGAADWIVYPTTTPVRKNGGGSQIGVAHVGSFSDSLATDGLVTSTWSDGATTASGSTHSLVFSSTGVGNGYSLTFPADTQQRTAYVIAGCYGANVNVTATLSDGSAAQQTSTIVWGGSGGVQAYIAISYAAASAGQTLTVTLTQASTGSYSNTSFQSAALSAPIAPVAPGPAPLTLTGYAPSVVRGVTSNTSPVAGAITLTGYAPTVTQGLSKTISPAPASLTITGYAPTVSKGARQSLTTGTPTPSTLVLTGYAPLISQGLNVVPHLSDTTIMRLSSARGTATLGPDRLQQTTGFP